MKLLQWVRSIFFIFQMYLMMVVFALAYAPWALFSARGARQACRRYAQWVTWTLKVICGIRTEVRGTPPTGNVIVGAKHHSFYDIMVIYNALPNARFIMKRELIYAPFLGLYALRMGTIPVARGKRGEAMLKLKQDVEAGRDEGGQLVIYPQGTRVVPGQKASYKKGIAVIYEQLEQPIVPVATNIGLFWPKRSPYRKPGLAVVEFMEPIPPGLNIAEVMARVEFDIESRSDKLMAEAGFKG